uniref:F-box domain-containing protein n=1 Tax=Aegilops tauschii TaxID=37682 RepID=M8BH72_AEGTA
MDAPAATVPDDVILEILVRLADEASLFRCAATCKLWRCLIADASFLCRRWPANSRHPSSLVGFLANKCHIHQGIMGLPMGSAAAQTFVPVPGPQPVFGRGRRSLGSLLPQTGILFDRVTPLASHGGLLLNDAAVQRGAAHWLCWDFSDVYDFAVNGETGQASLAKLPFPVATRFFLGPYRARQLRVGADGSLLFLRLHVQGLWIEIWTRQDSGTASSWLCTHLIEIEPPKADGVVDCICFGEKSGTLLLADQNWSSSYLVNIETGQVENMTERFDGPECKRALPVEIDWPAFFLSRLTGQKAVYMKRENAGSWNSGLEKEQILETYSAQLQKS